MLPLPAPAFISVKMLAALVAALPVVYYVVCGVSGIPVKRGEVAFLRAWLRYKESDTAWESGGKIRHIRCGANPDTMTTTGQAWVARRYDNAGESFVIVNLDKLPDFVLGMRYWRFRRLIARLAEEAGIPVLRIPLTAWDKVAARHGATFKLVDRDGRECVFSRTLGGETQFFLSGFDSNERPPLYFLTQLPRPVGSIADAREALKPGSVVAAEAAGRRVYRQGDMFAIPTSFTDQQITAAGGVIHSKSHSLYGTAHTADAVADLPDGTQLARGHLLHRPGVVGETRKPDHRPRSLKTNMWHLIAKNTTPMRRKGVTSL